MDSLLTDQSLMNFQNSPFNTLREGLEKSINNLKDSNKNRERFDIIASPTGVGKSYAQDTIVRDLIHKHFPNIKIIIRLAPTRDTANDGIFHGVHGNWRGLGFVSPKELEKQISFLEQGLTNFGDLYSMSMTHGIFLNENTEIVANFLKKYKENIFILIEEAHKFFACPIPGAKNSSKVYGNGGNAPYYAKMPLEIRKWMKTTPYVIGFTATPTVGQDKTYGDMNGLLELVSDNPNKPFKFYFDVIDCFPQNLKDLVPHQAWVKSITTYNYEHKDPHCIEEPLKFSISRLFKTQNKLEKIKNGFDPNITSKLVWLGVFGRRSGSGWGTSPNIAMQMICSHLKSINVPANTPCIIEMTEQGCFSYDLNGNKVDKFNEFDAVAKLNDASDPAQFLLSINKATAGLNIHRIGEIFVGRVRDIIYDRYETSNQIYGRGVRINTGTDILSKSEYKNDLRSYMIQYHGEHGVPYDVIAETIKTANVFNITIPLGVKFMKTKTKYARDIWGGAAEVFLEKYCNTIESGAEFLDDFIQSTGVKVCSLCGSLLSDKLHQKEYEFNQTSYSILNQFFNT